MEKILNEDLLNYWKQIGFDEPTVIQMELWPKLNNNQSVVAISPTGSGKTLAYLLPLMSKIKPDQTLQLIVLAPSQELVMQITEVAKEWADLLKVNVLPIVGSANLKRQIEALKDKPEVVIATPGRLIELANQSKKLKFHQVKSIVFDEADYLLEGDQEESIREIIKKVMRDTQQVWVSATFGESLKKYLDSTSLSIQTVMVSDTNDNSIEHVAILTQNRQKLSQLKKLAQIDNMQALVFFEQVNELETVAAKLIYDGVKIAVLHGQLSKLERQHAIQAIKNQSITFLLTTDVAARGIDIEDLLCVIHFNKVKDARTYTHRSGRTGRMGKRGMVISLANEQELRDLNALLSEANINIEERVVYKGEIISPQEREDSREQLLDSTNVGQSPKKLNQKTKKQKVSSLKSTSTKKKKNRKRDTKNKGKRKKV